jgi:dephospho-CoA kinase
MSLVYITGVSGSGKSAVRNTLIARGYEAFDVDYDGFAAHYDNTTGKKVSHVIRTKEWHEKHDWKISRPMVEELAKKAKAKLIFLCGVARNDNEVWDLFDKVFALAVDEKTLRKRLATRKDEFGKNEDELQIALGWQKHAEEKYRNLGATIVDNIRSVDKTVDEILRQIKS